MAETKAEPMVEQEEEVEEQAEDEVRRLIVFGGWENSEEASVRHTGILSVDNFASSQCNTSKSFLLYLSLETCYTHGYLFL